MKIDIACALGGIILVELATWISNAAPSNLTAGIITGLAVYCIVRLSGKK